MNNKFLIILTSLFLLNGCNKLNTWVVPITYLFNEECHKYINDSRSISYKNLKGEYVELDVSEFDIDFDSLIAGDALSIKHYGEGIVATSLPSYTYLYGRVVDVEVIYADIYEVILRKNDDTISFEHINEDINIEIYYNSKGRYESLSLDDDKIINKSFSEYEDGTILYYTYNEALEKYNYGSNFYDYLPR